MKGCVRKGGREKKEKVDGMGWVGKGNGSGMEKRREGEREGQGLEERRM